MKQIKFFAMALAALTMFSCSKETTPEMDNQGPGKTMQITVAKAPTSRAPGQSGGVTTITGDSYVLGFNGTEATSTLVYKTSAALVAGTATAVTGVPETAAHFAIVSNLSAADAGKITMGMAYSTYQALLFEVAAYQTIAIAPMTNVGTQTLDKDPQLWTLAVSIAPIVSRIEVASITANSAPAIAANKVTAFDLVGVHVNGYYTQFTMAGTSGGTQVALVTDQTLLRHADDGGAAGSTVQKWSYDYYNTALTGVTSYSAKTKTAVDNDIWYYMTSPAASNTMPRIVFEIKNVSVNGVSQGADKSFFVTVKSFTNGTDAITSIARNTIFKISDVTFDSTNLGVEPNQETVSVKATVTVLPWVPVAATPEL